MACGADSQTSRLGLRATECSLGACSVGPNQNSGLLGGRLPARAPFYVLRRSLVRVMFVEPGVSPHGGGFLAFHHLLEPLFEGLWDRVPVGKGLE